MWGVDVNWLQKRSTTAAPTHGSGSSKEDYFILPAPSTRLPSIAMHSVPYIRALWYIEQNYAWYHCNKALPTDCNLTKDPRGHILDPLYCTCGCRYQSKWISSSRSNSKVIQFWHILA